MDRLYIKQAGYYLAYRCQLACKFVVLCLLFGAALPIVYLFGALYFCGAEIIDRLNLLRNMAPPPRTSARLTFTMHTSVLPIGIVLHVAMGFVFFVHISLGGGDGKGSAAWELVQLSASPSPPPPSPPPSPPAGEQNPPRPPSEWASLSTDQLTAIWSTAVIAISATCILIGWWAHTVGSSWPCLPRAATSGERTLKAKLPRAARRLADAFIQRASGAQDDVLAANPTISAYIPPLTAALLTMHTAKARGASPASPRALRSPDPEQAAAAGRKPPSTPSSTTTSRGSSSSASSPMSSEPMPGSQQVV